MANVPITQVGTFHLDGPISRVFPLFTALGERAWAQDWDPQLLSGREERGSVFRTVHGGRETTWIVVDYRPSEGRVSYARLAQDSNIGLVDVRCSAAAGGGTEVSALYADGLERAGAGVRGEVPEPRPLQPHDRGVAHSDQCRAGIGQIGHAAAQWLCESGRSRFLQCRSRRATVQTWLSTAR